MRWLRAFLLRLGALFGKHGQERELTAEVESHLAMHIEDNLRAGMSPEEARRKALMKLGGIEQTKETYRQRRGLPFVETMTQDLRFALRVLGKSPGFTGIAVLALALGIGANTAMFSLVNAVLIRDLPVQDPKQLVFLRHQTEEGPSGEFDYAEFKTIRDSTHSFSGLFAFDSTSLLATTGGQSEFLRAQCVSGDFFSVLGVRPVVGRPFTVQDEQTGHPVVVISYENWRRNFALDSNVLGKNIVVKNLSFHVIGVAPPSFHGIELGDSIDAWMPMSYWTAVRLSDHLSVAMMGRLKSEIVTKQAAAELTVLDKAYALQALESNSSARRDQASQNRRMELRPGARGLFDLPDELPAELNILTGVVGLVLLIACANVANLLLSRAINRKREMALRLALGAGQGRLIRQMLTENMLLAFAGGLLGFLASDWATALLLRFTSAEIDPTQIDVRPDHMVFLFAASVSVLSALMFGLLPALSATRSSWATALRLSSGIFGGEARSRLQHGLVVIQVASCVLLLAGTGLMVRSLQNLSRVSVGFRQDHTLLASLYPTLGGYEGSRELNLYSALQERIGATPGVLSASFSRFALLSRGRWNRRIADPGSTLRQKETTLVHCNPVAPKFFATMGIPLILGRDFDARDTGSAPGVAILSETSARAVFGNRNPVGEHIDFQGEAGSRRTEVVGIVRDIRSSSLRSPDETPAIYTPLAQAPQDLLGQVTMEIRTMEEPDAAIARVRHAFRDFDTNLPVTEISTQAAQSSDSVGGERSLAALLGLFSVLAVVLASVGLYGVMAYSVARRTQEIGIRLALGARRVNLLRMVMGQGIRLTILGIAIGLCVAFAGGRVLSSNLFGVTSTDPITILCVALLLMGVALAACFVPARRAMRVDPIVALRYE